MNELVITSKNGMGSAVINEQRYESKGSDGSRQAIINSLEMRWIVENNQDSFNDSGNLKPNAEIIRPNITINDED